jgi:hypothetical protein
MNERQQLAFDNPLIGIYVDLRAFDQVAQVDDFTVITRLVCYGPNRSMGKWQASAHILTESGEKCSLIFVAEETKSKVRGILRDLLSGVGRSGTEYNELANGRSAQKQLTTEEFEQVVERVGGEEPLPPIVKSVHY